MSIPVTDEIVEEFCRAKFARWDEPTTYQSAYDSWRDVERQEIRFAITVALAVAPNPEPSGNPGELRDAIRAAVLLEREACAKTVFLLDPFDCQLEAAAEKIRSRPEPEYTA